MSESKANQCEFHLIKAWMPVSKPYLKASVKSITDLKIEGLTNIQRMLSMSHIDNNRYLVNVHDNDNKIGATTDTGIADMKSMTYDIITQSNNGIKSLINGDIVIIVHCTKTPIAIVKGKAVIGKIDIEGRFTCCGNRYPITDRWIQERGDDIFIIDRQISLYCIKWPDIKQGKYDIKTLIDTQVEDFFAYEDKPAILKQDGVLKVGSYNLDLRTIRPDAGIIKWSIVIRAAKHWIVSGDLDGQAIIASVNSNMVFGRSLSIEIKSNGYEGHTGIHIIHTVIDRHRASVMLACERDGCSHLLAVDSRGAIVVIRSLANMIPDMLMAGGKKYEALIQSVCRSHREGDITETIVSFVFPIQAKQDLEPTILAVFGAEVIPLPR